MSQADKPSVEGLMALADAYVVAATGDTATARHKYSTLRGELSAYAERLASQSAAAPPIVPVAIRARDLFPQGPGRWHYYDWANANPAPKFGEEVEHLYGAPPIVDLSDERIMQIGRRYAWQYKHNSDASKVIYTFNAFCLRDLSRAIEREIKGGDQWSRVIGNRPNGEPEYAALDPLRT